MWDEQARMTVEQDVGPPKFATVMDPGGGEGAQEGELFVHDERHFHCNTRRKGIQLLYKLFASRGTEKPAMKEDGMDISRGGSPHLERPKRRANGPPSLPQISSTLNYFTLIKTIPFFFINPK